MNVRVPRVDPFAARPFEEQLDVLLVARDAKKKAHLRDLGAHALVRVDGRRLRDHLEARESVRVAGRLEHGVMRELNDFVLLLEVPGPVGVAKDGGARVVVGGQREDVAVDEDRSAGVRERHHHDARRRVIDELPRLLAAGKRDTIAHAKARRLPWPNAVTVDERAVQAVEVTDLPTQAAPANRRVLDGDVRLVDVRIGTRAPADEMLRFQDRHLPRRHVTQRPHR